jgi:hypothetical protein
MSKLKLYGGAGVTVMAVTNAFAVSIVGRLWRGRCNYGRNFAIEHKVAFIEGQK